MKMQWKGILSSMKKKCFIYLFLVLLFTGCSRPQARSNLRRDEEDDDRCIADGGWKKSRRKMLADPEFRELLVLEQPEVKKSIEDTLLSKKGEDFWKKTFEDPKFTEKVAKSMKEQQQEIMKLLMDDSSFQKEMEEFFSQPDMQKQLETIMQSANMKKHIEKVVEETISSPLLQSEMAGTYFESR